MPAPPSDINGQGKRRRSSKLRTKIAIPSPSSSLSSGKMFTLITPFPRMMNQFALVTSHVICINAV